MEALISTSDKTLAMSSMNAAILVARTLVHAQLGHDQARFAEIVERARYCQLLAARTKLSPMQRHRTDLGAWLSAMDPQHSAAIRLAAEQGVQDVVFPESAPQRAPCVEADVLALVRFYQDLLKREPGARRDIKRIQQVCEAEWASSPDRQSLVKRFINILKDEIFLTQVQPVAGRVLIIDPEEIVAPLLAPPLACDGYEVRVAGNADEARNAISLAMPDVIISELDLPFVDGVEFCREIRANPQTSRIPFLIVTSSKSKSVARRCMREGVEDVMTKPVDLEMLFLKLKRVIVQPDRAGAGSTTAAGGVAGSLSDMNFVDMIQIVTAGGKSMAITLTSGDQKGEVVICQGEVIHAKTSQHEGDDAFYELMGWSSGTFAARQCTEFPARTIHTPVVSLLMEGSRLADEAGASADGPPPGAKP